MLEELAVKTPVQSKSRQVDIQNSLMFSLSTITTNYKHNHLDRCRQVIRAKDRTSAAAPH